MFPALSIPAEAEMKKKRGIWFYFMQMCDDTAKHIAERYSVDPPHSHG